MSFLDTLTISPNLSCTKCIGISKENLCFELNKKLKAKCSVE